MLPLLPNRGFKPASCLAVAVFGSVALMPLAGKAKDVELAPQNPIEPVEEPLLDQDAAEGVVEVEGEMVVGPILLEQCFFGLPENMDANPQPAVEPGERVVDAEEEFVDPERPGAKTIIGENGFSQTGYSKLIEQEIHTDENGKVTGGSFTVEVARFGSGTAKNFKQAAAGAEGGAEGKGEGEVVLPPTACGQKPPCEKVGEDGEVRIIELEEVLNEEPVIEEPVFEGHFQDPIQGDGHPATKKVLIGQVQTLNAEDEPVADDVTKPQAINPGFATDLYAQLRKTEGNVFFSPHSITEAMAMAHLGANGNTADEIEAAMSFDIRRQSVSKRVGVLNNALDRFINLGENTFKSVNAICVTGAMPDPSYIKHIRKWHEAEIFKGGVSELNAWVEKKTEGKIETILDELSEDSACVLLNAVYFKGKWLHGFTPHLTEPQPFHLTADQSVTVPFMGMKTELAHVQNEQWVALELPYENSCSMVLIMPTKADGMKDLEAALDEALVARICQQLKQDHQGKVSLRMPKFKIATEYNLVPPMKQLGINDAFVEGKADFTAMYSSGPPAFIGQIKHKATLEVDEKGSVSAAAMAVEMRQKSALRMSHVTLDRPFLVLIRDHDSNSTLFMGRISDPTK